MMHNKLVLMVITVCLLVISSVSLFGCSGEDRTPAPPANNIGEPDFGNVDYFDLVYLDNNRVLYWNDKGEYCIWVYDRRARGDADPLPGDPEVWGTWESIGSEDEYLIYLEHERVLQWNWKSGDYHIWVYDRSVRGNNDPFSGDPEVYGNWQTIKTGAFPDEHDVNLIYLGDDRVLEWHDDHGDYKIWEYDRAARGDSDPLVGPKTWGRWTSITDDGNHVLFPMGYFGYLFDIDQHGGYRLWCWDRSVVGHADPLVNLKQSGKWISIFSYKRVFLGVVMCNLIYLGQSRVLVWSSAGDYNYRIYVMNVNEDDPLTGPEVWGNWKTIR